MPPKIWLLYLILPGRFGLLLTALVIFAVLAALLGVTDSNGAFFSSGALFFSAMPAYIIPVFSYINRISLRAVEDLRDFLDMPEEEFQAFKSAISHKSLVWNLLVTGLGLVGGMLHLLYIRGDQLVGASHGLMRPAELLDDLGTLVVWVVMTITIFSLVENAVRIGRLAQRLQPINLFRTDRLLPFARVAVTSCLLLIGSFALYPLLSIDEGISVLTLLPGIVATVVPMIFMLMLPIWPAHRLIKTSKALELAHINSGLDDLQHRQGVLPDHARVDALNRLLEHRQHIQRVPDWPLDVGVVSRLAFYLIIPPLTWIGAALIENAVDALL